MGHYIHWLRQAPGLQIKMFDRRLHATELARPGFDTIPKYSNAGYLESIPESLMAPYKSGSRSPPPHEIALRGAPVL